MRFIIYFQKLQYPLDKGIFIFDIQFSSTYAYMQVQGNQNEQLEIASTHQQELYQDISYNQRQI